MPVALVLCTPQIAHRLFDRNRIGTVNYRIYEKKRPILVVM